MSQSEKRKIFSCYTHSECRTGKGQLVEFTCRPEDVEKIKAFLTENLRTIEIPATCAVENISHGGYGRYTRYKIIQHKYAGGGYQGCGGFIEVLEIKNPPDNRCGFVIYLDMLDMDSYDSAFFEFKTLEDAKEAFENSWSAGRSIRNTMTKQKGYLRTVECGFLSPWFYAVADQNIVGDLVFPNVVVEDDPVYRVFRKFIVRDYDGLPTIKICFGCVYYETGGSYPDYKKHQHKKVFWNDGTVWDDSFSSHIPKPLDEKTIWIQEAIDNFRNLIAGKTDKFEIEFINGDKFIGRFSPKDKRRHHKEGRYKARIKYKKGRKTKIIEGEFDFKPTLEVPTVEDSLNKQAKDRGAEIVSIESVVRTWWSKGRDKKWSGIYVE